MAKKTEKEINVEELLEQIDKTETIEKDESDVPFEERIETERLNLFNLYVKNKKRSNIVMIITVLLVIGCFILIAQKNEVLNIIGYSLAGCVIVGMLVFYFLTKSKFPKATKEYINFVTSTFNKFNYKATEYSDIKCDPEEKVELAEIIADDLYKDVNQISSRNVIHGKYMNHSFLAADVALYSGNNKTRKTDFVGKYISLGNDLKFTGKIIIVSKTEEKSVDLPTNLDDLEVVLEDGSFILYASKEIKDCATSIIKDKFINVIKGLKIDETLLNVNVVIWAGHTAYYLSYSDDVIALPFEKPFVGDAMKTFERQQRELFQSSMEHFE